MKVSDRKGIAGHPDLESCAATRKGVGEALTGEAAGQVSSCEITVVGMPTVLTEPEGNTDAGAICEPKSDPAQSKALCMRRSSLCGSQEIPEVPGEDGRLGRPGKTKSLTPGVHASGKSDGRIVPAKLPNKGEVEASSAEGVEGRRPTKGNAREAPAHRTQSRDRASTGLTGVREVARRDRRARFTALLHHVTIGLLRDSYFSLKRDSAAGVDGVTWQEYGANLEGRLRDLHARVHRGSYRALPSRRVYIPKADGRQRPLGIAALEDKIVQYAVVVVLNQIYEVDFKGFSYGFRPGRGQHMALDALFVALMEKKVNWVLDADIQSFFDTIDHGWLLKFLEHRIADRRVLRLIRKWLKAGVLEGQERQETEKGTPQGAVISPLLANVYLHYALDLWVDQWRRRQAQGQVILVRFADDAVMGIEERSDAERLREDLRERLQKFGLTLHPEKTRLIEFGRNAARERKRRGEGAPETFDFLGFTHISGRARRGGQFLVNRRTSSKKQRTKLQEVKVELRKRQHRPMPEVGKWLGRVVQGHLNYYAVSGNMPRLEAFDRECRRNWLTVLRRRGQRHPISATRFGRLADRWLPRLKILHPYPNVRFHARTQGRSRMR